MALGVISETRTKSTYMTFEKLATNQVLRTSIKFDEVDGPLYLDTQVVCEYRNLPSPFSTECRYLALVRPVRHM